MKAEAVFLDGKEVGEIVNRILYVSYRRQSKHLYRGGESTIPAAKTKGKAAWGVSQNLLNLLEARGVALIAVHDKETKKTHFVSLQRFNTESEIKKFKGDDLQRFLTLKRWTEANLGNLIEAAGKVAA